MEVNLLRHQWEFLTNKTKFLLLLGGVGSGKTWSGSHYIIGASQAYSRALGGIFANTHKQLLNSTLSAAFAEFEKVGLSYKYNQNRGILNLEGATLICSSLENFDALRGLEIGYGWMDECAYSRREAFEMLMGRLRDKNGPLELRLTTTPKGYNWLYDYFYGEKKTEEMEVITAKSSDNVHLPCGYVESLTAQYDDKLIKQEMEGQFVNTTSGKIYYAFDRTKVVRPVARDPNLPITTGVDFNVNPMTAVITQVTEDKILVIGEVWLGDSNTHELCEHLKALGLTGCKLIPDSTGSALKTSSAGMSDHHILKQAGFQIPAVRNPFRIDRYNTVNNLLEKGRIIIDPKCKHLINDLERVSYKEGTNFPDTVDKSLTHISDALGYVSNYAFPLVQRKIISGRYA